LPIICRLVSKQFFHRLFIFYQGKTKDQSNWALRKACVEIIIDISELCEPNERELVLTEIMLTLLKDSNKWVRVSAYKSLGRFIYSLKGQKINEKLTIEFCKMVENEVNAIGKDN
jgi:serine/threonine-protein phosphatase 4 regulatory subunit 1